MMLPLQELNTALKKSDPNSGIRLSTPDEIQKWSATIGDASRQLTAIINDWSLVTIKYLGGGEYLHLVGDVVGTTKIRVTSPALRIDLKSGFLITLSESIYQLGNRHEGEPDRYKVLAISQSMLDWRRTLSVDVPETLQ